MSMIPLWTSRGSLVTSDFLGKDQHKFFTVCGKKNQLKADAFSGLGAWQWSQGVTKWCPRGCKDFLQTVTVPCFLGWPLCWESLRRCGERGLHPTRTGKRLLETVRGGNAYSRGRWRGCFRRIWMNFCAC